MKLVPKCGMALLLAGCLAAPALAGPNAGGTLFAHDASMTYTSDIESYCGQGTAPASCDGADVRIDGSDADNVMVWKVYAAFLDGSSPRLKGMTWGVDYNADDLLLTAWGPCIGDPNNGAAEFPGAGWPEPNTGTSLAWEETQTGLLTEVYWFAGYQYGDPSVFQLQPHSDPVLEGMFGDDAIPAVLDPIAGFGSVGFGTDGATACPVDLGTCCSLVDGSCVLLSRVECEAEENRQYMGGPSCEAFPCAQNAPCCVVTTPGVCDVIPVADCLADGNLPGLIGTTCTELNNNCATTVGACCQGTECIVTTAEDCPEDPWFALQPCVPDNNYCSDPTNPPGACCLFAACIVTRDNDCEGIFVPYESCTPENTDMCATPTETTTWGRIKARY